MLLLLSIWTALAARDKVRRNGASLAFIDIYNVLHQVLGLCMPAKKLHALVANSQKLEFLVSGGGGGLLRT